MKKSSKLHYIVILCTLLVLLLTACDGTLTPTVTVRTATPTLEITSTNTPTPVAPTSTQTPTLATPTLTPTPTETQRPTPTTVPTNTPTNTPANTPTLTETSTLIPTLTPTPTSTSTPTQTPSPTPSPAPTQASTPTPTPTTSSPLPTPTMISPLPTPIPPTPTNTPIPTTNTAIIADHTTTFLSEIPEYWLEQARQLHIYYGYTSHGSQPITGMTDLLNLPLPYYLYHEEAALGQHGDLRWYDFTVAHLAAHPETDVVIWAWCNGLSVNVPGETQIYLDAMADLEARYPSVTFVYQTGHTDGTGLLGHLHANNEMVRAWVRDRNGVLYDFGDIESYDPDRREFLSLGADEDCSYISGNWADEWCAEHPGHAGCAYCECLHSRPLNCYQKGKAFWWLLARLAGWEG